MTAVAPVPDHELEFIGRAVRSMTVRKGGYFIRAGEVPRHIGFVARGLLRIYYIGENAAEFTTRFFVEGTFAASYADFMEQRPTRFFVQALEESVLLGLEYRTYMEMLRRDTCWQVVGRKLVEEVFARKLDRENDLLSRNAEERYRRFILEYPGLETRLKQYHIASYLGINPVSLSRIRAKLKSS